MLRSIRNCCILVTIPAAKNMPTAQPIQALAALAALLPLSPLHPQTTAGNPFSFEDVTEAADLERPLAGMLGHGAAWGDFDKDGHLDLFVGGFADRPDADYAPSPTPVPNRLLRNRGDGTFEPANFGPSGPDGDFARTSGALFADLSNDGYPELYVANNARPSARSDRGEIQAAATTRLSVLYQNRDGTLVELPPASGASPASLLSARNVGALDFNRDGLLDLLIVEDRFTANPRTTLLRNLGDLRFEDATVAAGLPEDIHGLGLAIADLNSDGLPDFFVPHSNRLFLSRGDSTYREAIELTDLFRHEPFDNEDWPCGAAFADLTRNGHLDLILTTHSERGRIRLFLNDGPGVDGIPQFRDVTAEAGLDAVIPTKIPHVEAQDFDNDGWSDLYVSAGWLKDDTFTPLIFHHRGLSDGIPHFSADHSPEGEMVYYPAGPTADFDGDGKMDIFLCNWFEGNRSRLLRNTAPPRQWLQIQIQGTKMNHDGIGASISIYAPGDRATMLGHQQISTGFGYASGQPAIAHFGLADQVIVDVEIRLPDGTTISRPATPAGQRLLVVEP
jgi:enediyne biosynthesis protein E4